MIPKIKNFVKEHKNSLLLTILFIFNSLFFLSLGIIEGGKLFQPAPMIIEKDLLWEKEAEAKITTEDSLLNQEQTENRFVASSRGKYYYPINCSLANNLSEKNKIYFSSKEEAESRGYIYQTKCDNY